MLCRPIRHAFTAFAARSPLSLVLQALLRAVYAKNAVQHADRRWAPRETLPHHPHHPVSAQRLALWQATADSNSRMPGRTDFGQLQPCGGHGNQAHIPIRAHQNVGHSGRDGVPFGMTNIMTLRWAVALYNGYITGRDSLPTRRARRTYRHDIHHDSTYRMAISSRALGRPCPSR